MAIRVPLGIWIQQGLDLITSHSGNKLHFFSESLSQLMGSIIDLLAHLHPGIIVVGFSVGLAVIKRDWKAPLLSILGLGLIINLGYWQETLETFALVFISTALATGLGFPIGLVCAHSKIAHRILEPLFDFMQTIPTFVYLIPTLMLFGLGVTPGIISTVVFAMPVVVRMTHIGVTQVPPQLTEVSNAFGATWFQKLIYIEIPYAFPTILSGISQCLMLSLSMVVIAAMVGADGLGKPVVEALNTVNIAKGFESGIAIVILSLLINQILSRKTSLKFQNGVVS